MAYRTPVTDHSFYANMFRSRVVFAAIICLILLIVLLVRLGYLQVIENAHFSDLSKDNRIRLMALPPTRGLIYDRNGIILAKNRPSFHLELVPELVPNLKATIAALGKLVKINPEDIKQFYADLANHRPFESVSLRSDLSDAEVARLAANRYRFPGMDITARLTRYYPHGADVAQAVGYVGRINDRDLSVINTSNYRGTKYIGKTGLERYYEDDLHGIVGSQEVEVNAEGRILRTIKKTPPVPGNDLILSLDLELQKIAYKALGKHAGAVVAIRPQTGQVLVFVSKPSFNPNLFVDGISKAKYEALQHATYSPLFNRALYGQYPPGSTFKPFIGLAALNDGVVTPQEKIDCKGYYLLPGDKTKHRYRDWKAHGETDMHKAIEQSCDVYFYTMAHRLGIDRIYNFLSQFGFGKKTGIDLYGERSGLLPSRAWKRRVRHKIWYPGETLISGIGQGYNLVTPLQLASATATLAERGVRRQPHLVSEIRNTHDQYDVIIKPEESTIKLHNNADWNVIINGMRAVVSSIWGTAHRSAGLDLKYSMAGKTGTAQVFDIAQGKKYNYATVKQKLRDHGLFISFAPIKNPQIAVAVVVENGGHGSEAAPVARKVIDHYLLDDGYLKKAEANGGNSSSN